MAKIDNYEQFLIENEGKESEAYADVYEDVQKYVQLEYLDKGRPDPRIKSNRVNIPFDPKLNMTIGYGHRILSSEWANFNQATLSEMDMLEILRNDITIHRSRAENIIENGIPGHFPPTPWESLSETQKTALTDYEFNPGISQFPKLTAAIVSGNVDAIRTEFWRHAGTAPLGRRNEDWWDTFGEPLTGATFKEVLDERNGIVPNQPNQPLPSGKSGYAEGDPSGHTLLDYVDKAFSPEAIRQAEEIVLGNPLRDVTKRSGIQDMQDTAQVVWHNLLASAGNSAAGVASEFIFETLKERLSGLLAPINEKLEPINEFDDGEDSVITIPAHEEQPLEFDQNQPNTNPQVDKQ